MTRSDAVIILQARMASTRLPRKALAHVGGRTLLARCLERLRRSAAAPVLLATTTEPEDDVLDAEAQRLGIPTFRGARDDVLTRFIEAAAVVGARFVIRATADNPAVDMDAPSRVLNWICRTDADHVVERGLPYGAAVEAVSVEALCRAGARTDDPVDREHVTALIRRDLVRFNALEIDAPSSLSRPDLRLTVDTADDLHFMNQIWIRLGNPSEEPPLAAIIAAADGVVDRADGAGVAGNAGPVVAAGGATRKASGTGANAALASAGRARGHR
jgi:spore coat polysaccharide biosynthesis protein SpsF